MALVFAHTCNDDHCKTAGLWYNKTLDSRTHKQKSYSDPRLVIPHEQWAAEVRLSISLKTQLSLPLRTLIHTFPRLLFLPPCLMAVSVWWLCVNTIFQKANLLVVSQKRLFFLIICHEAICSCEFRALFCWYVRDFSSRVNIKTGWSNWLPVCHERFTRLPVWSTTDSFKALNICSIKHQHGLTYSTYTAANLLSSMQTKRYSLDNTIWGHTNHSKHPYNSMKFSTGQHFSLGTAWKIKFGLINKCRACVFKGLWMRLLAAHTAIKANFRSRQRLCSHCLIETIPYLLISTKGIREQAKTVSFPT